MKSEQVLSIDQMNHLQELGLDTSDASMCWEWKATYEDDMVVNSLDADTNYDCYYPTYTLQDILNKLPISIGNNTLSLQRYGDKWVCLYIEPYTRYSLHMEIEENCIDVVYDMLCWCNFVNKCH
mgnify:CR=1 FL=1